MKTAIVLVILLMAALVVAVPADTIAQWNYNGLTATTADGSSHGALSWTGDGIAADVDNAQGQVSTQKGLGTVWDAAAVYTTGAQTGFGRKATQADGQYAAYSTQNYIALNSGVGFMVSTVGYTNITASFDARRSGTAPTAFKWVYTIDGSTWQDVTGGAFTMLSNTNWQGSASSFGSNQVAGMSIDLSSVAGINGISSFGIGFVNTATAASGGTFRFDNVTVSGTLSVPEPGSVLALTSGLIGMAGFVIRRKRS